MFSLQDVEYFQDTGNKAALAVTCDPGRDGSCDYRVVSHINVNFLTFSREDLHIAWGRSWVFFQQVVQKI